MANLGNLALTAGNRVRTILDTAERTALALLVQTLRRRGPLSPFLRRRMLRILQRGLIQARTEALRQYRQAYDAAARELETLAADIGRDAAALRDALPPKLPEPSVDASAILRHMRRDVDDLFRDIQEAAVAHREETGATVGAAMQEVLDAFAESGITSFTDAGGRRWGLQEYANMVVRTGVQRAGLQATVDRMLANGWDLCFVTPHMGCCPQCAAWQGVVMSLTGKSEGYPTVQQAMDGGLFHPNCAHVLQVYIPGVSDLSLGIPKGFTRDSNAKLYTARQRQRFIERKIRQAKREQAAAFTPEAEQAAREELRRWQAAARANARGEVQRRYDRERVMVGRHSNNSTRWVNRGIMMMQENESSAIPKEYENDYSDFQTLSLDLKEVRVLKLLRALTDESGFEYGTIRISGEMSPPFTSEDPNRVSVPGLYKTDKRFSLYHAHTNATILSGKDLKLLITEELEKVTVITKSGEVFSVSVGGGIRPTEDEFDNAFSWARSEAERSMLEQGRAGGWTGEQIFYMVVREQARLLAGYFEWELEGGRF